MEKITFQPEGEEPVDFFVLEQTVIGAKSYILVTDVEDGDGEALILRDELMEKFPNHNIIIDPLSLSVSCHIGPGSLAVTVSKKHNI